MAKRAGIILDGPIVEKLRFLRMGIKSTGPNRVAEIRWISAGWEYSPLKI